MGNDFSWNWAEQSRGLWGFKDKPGEEVEKYVAVGCLQRIATSLESIASSLREMTPSGKRRAAESRRSQDRMKVFDDYEERCLRAFAPYFRKNKMRAQVATAIHKARIQFCRGNVSSPVVNWESPDYDGYRRGTRKLAQIVGFIDKWKADGMPGKDLLDAAAEQLELALKLKK